MSLDLIHLALSDSPASSAMELLRMLDPSDESDSMIIEAIMRTTDDFGFGLNSLDPTDSRNFLEQTSPAAANFHEIGEDLSSYAWSY